MVRLIARIVKRIRDPRCEESEKIKTTKPNSVVFKERMMYNLTLS